MSQRLYDIQFFCPAVQIEFHLRNTALELMHSNLKKRACLKKSIAREGELQLVR